MDRNIILPIIHRRRAATVAAVFACIQIENHISRRGNGIRRPLFSFEIFARGLQPNFFSRLYRMSKGSFFLLADKLEGFESASELRSCKLMRLSIALRWLGGGSYLDIAIAHQLSISSVYKHINDTISAIDNVLNLHFPYNDNDWLASSSLGFSRDGKSPINGCIAALDGIAIKINEPSSRDVCNPSTYYNRKGFFALNVQALCDSSYKFLFVSAITPGSSHDSSALAMSSLADLLKKNDGGIKEKYWIAGDAAYVCTNRLLTPWPGKNLPVSKDCFNYWQSSARIHIEQAFGILVARWGIFWRPMRVRLFKASRIVMVCCKLHNFIIDNSQTVTVPRQPPLQEDPNNPIDQDIHLQDTCDTEIEYHDRRRDIEISVIRSALTKSIKDKGLERPPVY